MKKKRRPFHGWLYVSDDTVAETRHAACPTCKRVVEVKAIERGKLMLRALVPYHYPPE